MYELTYWVVDIIRAKYAEYFFFLETIIQQTSGNLK